MACSISTFSTSPVIVSVDAYIGAPTYYTAHYRYTMDSASPSFTSPTQGRNTFPLSGPQPIANTSNVSIYSHSGWPSRSRTSPTSPNFHQYPDHAWPSQSHSQHSISTKHHSFASYSEAAYPPQFQPQQQYTKSHSRSYSGDARAQRRDSQQSISQSYFPPNQLTKKGHSSSHSVTSIYCGGPLTSSSSPPSSPPPFSDALSPVHPLYAGLPRTDSGLIPIPAGHVFNRGEIVMTRTTRRLMKTSSTGRLTARHPCLIVEATESHVRVLQMTSHVQLTGDQVRVVGAQLQHWLAREDPTHRDAFGRPGLQTSPPSDRAGYIWVGDGGEWVPIEHIKYLTGTRVDEHEIQRLENLTFEYATTCPFRPNTP